METSDYEESSDYEVVEMGNFYHITPKNFQVADVMKVRFQGFQFIGDTMVFDRDRTLLDMVLIQLKISLERDA